MESLKIITIASAAAALVGLIAGVVLGAAVALVSVIG
jgi:hypothetical protein